MIIIDKFFNFKFSLILNQKKKKIRNMKQELAQKSEKKPMDIEKNEKVIFSQSQVEGKPGLNFFNLFINIFVQFFYLNDILYLILFSVVFILLEKML